jgi:hypothetical protein
VVIFKYYRVAFYTDGELVDKLNELGQEGWELVTMVPTDVRTQANLFTFYFKKKVQPLRPTTRAGRRRKDSGDQE